MSETLNPKPIHFFLEMRITNICLQKQQKIVGSTWEQLLLATSLGMLLPGKTKCEWYYGAQKD
jgi:hypothetical protein